MPISTTTPTFASITSTMLRMIYRPTPRRSMAKEPTFPARDENARGEHKTRYISDIDIHVNRLTTLSSVLFVERKKTSAITLAPKTNKTSLNRVD
jgi:hypothetical protein